MEDIFNTLLNKDLPDSNTNLQAGLTLELSKQSKWFVMFFFLNLMVYFLRFSAI